MSGLYGHPYFSKISDIAPEAWGHALSYKIRTPAANVAGVFCESLDSKNHAETFCMSLLQWTSEALCCYHSILVISHNHENFRFLAATILGRESACFHWDAWIFSCSKSRIYDSAVATVLFENCSTSLRRNSCELPSVLRLADAEPTLQLLLVEFESRFWKQAVDICFMRNFFT
jgi:hypothetical protein